MLFEKTALKFCYEALTAKTIFDKSRLYCSGSLEIFQNISAFLYLIAWISSNLWFKVIIIVLKTRCDLLLSIYFNQDYARKDILQIISGPVYKILVVSKSYDSLELFLWNRIIKYFWEHWIGALKKKKIFFKYFFSIYSPVCKIDTGHVSSINSNMTSAKNQLI